MRPAVTLCGSLLLAACAHYTPRPLDPRASAVQLEQRQLIGSESGLWHPEELLRYALANNAGVRESHEQLRAALAAVDTAHSLPNPTLGVALDRYTAEQAGSSPWLWGLSLDIPVSAMANRSLQSALAQTSVRQARLSYADRIWQLRTDLRSAVLGRLVADEQVRLAAQQLYDSRALQSIRAARVSAGENAAADNLQAQLEVLQAEQELSVAQKSRLQADAQLAVVLSVSPVETQAAKLSWSEFQDVNIPDARRLTSLREQALLARSDVERALSEYEARELELRLQVRAQFPQLTLGPGYTYDHGVKKLTLAASLTLPIFNRNSGPIAEAEAQRSAAGLHLESVQSTVMQEIDTARAELDQATTTLAGASETRSVAEREMNRARREQQAGAADRLDLLGAKLVLARARRSELEARAALQQSMGALENALRTPLDFAVDAKP